MKIEDVNAQIVARLCDEPWPKGGPDRTDRVFQVLDEVAVWMDPAARTQHHRHPKGTKFGEWLLDFVALDEPTQHMLLVAESTLTETTAEQVLDDFVKLLQVRAPVKVLVYTMEPVILVPELIRSIRAYKRHQEGEGFLLIRIDWRGAAVSQKVIIGPGASVPDPVRLPKP